MSANEHPQAPAIALLARPGAARERLREALSHAGVTLVLEEDPADLDGERLLACAPQAVVIALEPAVEDALERLEDVLSSPAFMLVFDEAELAARRDGWEIQRWGRHLAAKLHGHQHVLPPGAEVERELTPEPGLERPAREVLQADLDAHLDQAADTAPSLPEDGVYRAPDALAEPQTLEAALDAWVGRDADADVDAKPAQAGPPPLPGASANTPAPYGDHTRWSLIDDESTSSGPAAASGDVAATAAVPALPAFDTDRLQLVALDTEPRAPARGAQGAVVVLAGIGGPDALRRLLSALPQRLDVPLLVRMPLEGARYGNLVKQMARVSSLPVLLAEPGDDVQAGHVYILSDDTAVALVDGGLVFQLDPRGIDVAALPPMESAVIVLSGTDLAQVDPALRLAEAGAWVGGQVGEGCYDPAAATAVVASGMFAGEPQELAQAIAGRWALDEGEQP